MTTTPQQPHHVVIVGAGFGGLEAAFGLAGAPVAITLIDRRNHHLFQPLLYQVATASLATSEIAWPVRHLMRDRREVTTLFATVSGVDADRRCVLIDDGSEVPYDTLVLATGARHAYFGHDEWEQFAPGLKTLEDGTTLRRHILVAFERAERETDPEKRAAAREDPDLGRRRPRLARGRVAGCAGRPCRTRRGGGRSHDPRSSRNLCDWRHRFDQRLGGQACARYRAGRQAAGPSRGRHHQ